MIALLLRAALDVRTANWLGALFAGHPAHSEALDCIAWRESRHTLVSVHKGDAWMRRSLGDGWSTRGVHGMVAKYAWPHVPSWLQWSPAVLDVPLVSAFVATRRATAKRCSEVRGCVTWRQCW